MDSPGKMHGFKSGPQTMKSDVKIDGFKSGPETDEKWWAMDGFNMLQKLMDPLAKWMVSKNDKSMGQS